MGKKEKEARKKAAGASAPLLPPIAQYAVAAAVAIVAVSLGCVLFRGVAGRRKPEAPAPAPAPPKPAKNKYSAAAEEAGLGPDVMQGQTVLLHRLMTLLQEVDGLKGEDQVAERRAVSKRVEKEIDAIEKGLAVDPSTSAGKQQAGLIALVRAALHSDQEGESFADWSEESLMKEHGLTTYASQTYWDEAYRDNKYGANFDWYGSWTEPDLQGQSLASMLRPLIPQTAKILMLGCGNSNMSAYMYEEGFRNIVNVDISIPVIKSMQERYSHMDGMTWIAMNAAALEFANETFDVAIEKGLFDALFAGTGTQVLPVLSEVQRILRNGGRFLSVSFSADRLERLFAPEDGEPSLNCDVKGKLKYAKNKDKTAQDGSKGFSVYNCEKPT